MSESITQVWEKLGTMRRKPFSEKERVKFLDVVLLYIEKKWSWDVLKDFIFGVLELLEGSHEDRDLLEPIQSVPSIREATRPKMLAEIVMAHATQDPEVTSYREEVLGGILLKWSDLQA